jgi:hypothetical protein
VFYNLKYRARFILPGKKSDRVKFVAVDGQFITEDESLVEALPKSIFRNIVMVDIKLVILPGLSAACPRRSAEFFSLSS